MRVGTGLALAGLFIGSGIIGAAILGAYLENVYFRDERHCKRCRRDSE